MRRALGLLLASALAGCAAQEGVVRVVDGRPTSGEFVPAEAYAAFLRAKVAEESGDLAGAVEGYAVASALGPSDPEPLARLGDARCRRDARDRQADVAIERALAIDGAYAPALVARARCAVRRGDPRLSVESFRRAAAADPAAAEPLGALARAATPSAEEGGDLRARIEALTLIAGTDAGAWDALAIWGRAHGDGPLEARALGRLAALVPSRRAEVSAAALRLAGEGETVAARALARARLEASGGGPVDPRVARLAIDRALQDGDVSGALRIATRSRLTPTVVAARALLLGDSQAARSIAGTVLAADPGAVGARMVAVAAAEAQGDSAAVAQALAGATPSSAAVPAEAWLAFGREIARRGSTEGARAVLSIPAREPLVAGDPLATPLAVALAASGALDSQELDADGKIELAERRGEAAPPEVIASADPRHQLLALARRAPRDPETIALARHLAHARSRDTVVAVAFARLALAGVADTLPPAEVLARLDPSDPLIATVALDCALRAGDPRAIPAARARLAALAHTPAERARLVE